MADIQSEAKFIWNIIKFFLSLPVTLVMILLKKKEFGELFTPIKEAWEFFWEAKTTAVLIVLNIVIFFGVIILVVSGVLSETFIDQFLVNHPGDIFEFKFIPLLGSIFFHGGIAHLFGNMLVLLILGRVVEKHFGTGKMLLFYFGAGIISSVGDSVIRHLMGDTIGGVGASGAISGLASTAMLISPFSFTFLLFGLPIPIFLVAWIFVANDVSGLIAPVAGDNVGHIAHLAGFFATMILAFFMSSEEKQKMLKGLLINAAMLIVMGVLWWFFVK